MKKAISRPLASRQYLHKAETTKKNPRQSFQEGITARAPMMMSPTVGRSQDFHPQSRSSNHHLQQGHDARASRLLDCASVSTIVCKLYVEVASTIITCPAGESSLTDTTGGED
jgi:hypothetical protein